MKVQKSDKGRQSFNELDSLTSKKKKNFYEFLRFSWLFDAAVWPPQWWWGRFFCLKLPPIPKPMKFIFTFFVEKKFTEWLKKLKLLSKILNPSIISCKKKRILGGRVKILRRSVQPFWRMFTHGLWKQRFEKNGYIILAPDCTN